MSRVETHHTEWLELLEISGPFLSPPVLDRAFPQGLDVLDTEHTAKLRLAREEWAEEQDRPKPDPQIHEQWIRFVLGETLDYSDEVLQEQEAIPGDFNVEIKEHHTTLRPDFILADPDTRKARLLVHVHPPTQELDAPIPDDRWVASPDARMVYQLHATGVRLGLVTNGERWMLVDSPEGETVGYVSWYSWLWSAEPLTLRAFQSLLSVQRFFGVEESETLEALLAESVSFQAEVTEQLGAQVRRAVETLVQALDRADVDTGRKLLRDLTEAELYEAAITVMMRLVFLFFAEENDLLPLSDDLYQQHYAASTIREQLAKERDKVGVEVLEKRQDAWNRLLATFRAIYGGVQHDQLQLSPYGGSLFDPDRFSFLEGRIRGTTWRTAEANPLPVDNRTVLHLLEALQILQVKGGKEAARKLSFRALDIEQIGHVYEMLLDHRVDRALTPTLGLKGAKNMEPEVPIAELEERAAGGDASLVEFLSELTKKTPNSIRNALSSENLPSEWEAKLLVACGNDGDLLARTLPYHALIRMDPWGAPIIFREGSLYVTSGTERRATGTYYTPRALTEEIVTHALEPLVYRGPGEGKAREKWELKSPIELLDLKVCDPAMGSGAFLVQVVRYLSERLTEAWDLIEDRNSGAITPQGEPARGSVSELLVPRDSSERIALARRLVADRCVYGVDINPLAVEMAKLSLWLVTLAKGRPFSFLDHSLKCGDSLLGVDDLNQILHLHPNPARGKELHQHLFDPTERIRKTVDRALELRQELESFTTRDVRDSERKAELNRKAADATSHLRVLGDLIIGAALSTSEKGNAALDARLKELSLGLADSLDLAAPTVDLQAEAMVMLNAQKPPMKPDRRPFHWAVEFPEVSFRDRRGFDVMVGNPPFLGGTRISLPHGKDYRTYLGTFVAGSRSDRADLCAFFLRRMSALTRPHGLTSVIATSTIAEGDTREVGLNVLLTQSWRVIRATRARSWPGNESLQVSLLWLIHGEWGAASVLDGRNVARISSNLAARRATGSLARLDENEGLTFEGWKPQGKGFLLDENEARALLEADPRNNDVIRPYMNGEDLNTRPDQSPSRFIITFWNWPLPKAEEYPECLEIVQTRVKPERQKNRRRAHRAHWWLFGETRPGLTQALVGLNRVLVVSRVSKYALPMFVPTGPIFSEALVVFATEDSGLNALLNSIHHRLWTIENASTFGKGIRYTPTDCFLTFPLPELNQRLRDLGEQLQALRSGIMGQLQVGLTELYNVVHDPGAIDSDVVALRQLHEAIDRETSQAFGWDDFEFERDFFETPEGFQFTLSPEQGRTLTERLAELNLSRAGKEMGLT